MFKNSNIKFGVLTIVICGLVTFSQWSTKQQYNGFVKVNYTDAGMFIITGKKIYTVNELETDEPVKVASLKSIH